MHGTQSGGTLPNCGIYSFLSKSNIAARLKDDEKGVAQIYPPGRAAQTAAGSRSRPDQSRNRCTISEPTARGSPRAAFLFSAGTCCGSPDGKRRPKNGRCPGVTVYKTNCADEIRTHKTAIFAISDQNRPRKRAIHAQTNFELRQIMVWCNC